MAPSVESILDEAKRLVHGDRQKSYGSPWESFGRVAEAANALLHSKLARPLTAQDIGLLMVLVKLVRQTYAPKRDNLVDIAGYAEVLDLINGSAPDSQERGVPGS